MTSLKNKTIVGLFWSGIDGYGGFILKFGFSILIARLLLPEDYGLIGMMAIFIALATMFSDGGFQDALIQKKEPTQKDFSSVFVFQVVLAIILYIILFFSAESIAKFYNEPRLVLITKVISLSFVVSVFGGTHVAWYTKKIDLKTYTKINVSSSLVSGIIGALFAVFGYGVWALIFQTLSGNIIRTALYWIFNPWKPSLLFSIESMKKLFSYGSKMFLMKLINALFMNIYFPLIGKLFPIETLGYYTRAKRFQDLAVIQTWVTFNKVLFPAFSSLQDEHERFRNAIIKSFSLMVFFIYPFITVLIVTAFPFIEFFLTSKWLPVVPYMQLLYLLGFTGPFIAFNLNTTNAQGRNDITLKLNIFSRILLVISIFVSYSFGVVGLIIGHVIVAIISYFISAYVCGNRITFGIKPQFIIVLPILLIATIAGLMGYSLTLIYEFHPFILLLVQTVSVIFIYFILMKIIKPTAYKRFKELARSKMAAKYYRFL